MKGWCTAVSMMDATKSIPQFVAWSNIKEQHTQIKVTRVPVLAVLWYFRIWMLFQSTLNVTTWRELSNVQSLPATRHIWIRLRLLTTSNVSTWGKLSNVQSLVAAWSLLANQVSRTIFIPRSTHVTHATRLFKACQSYGDMDYFNTIGSIFSFFPPLPRTEVSRFSSGVSLPLVEAKEYVRRQEILPDFFHWGVNPTSEQFSIKDQNLLWGR
jgi:hypothetical protein